MFPVKCEMKVDVGLPDELLSPLYPNIGLAGLNLKNPLHSSIWDAFSTNMHSDNGPGRYMLVKDYNMFPKRNEGTNKPPPTGILQRGWFNKHLNLIPAAVILFYELDWNDSHWAEKQLDCGLQLNYLRSGLGNRATKLAVVLIQKNSLPAGEDALAVERATSLCNACELMSNSLFVLPVLHADHLVGYVIRLQNVFIDQAVLYYLNETKRIKNNKDTLNRPNYQLLQARHLIKVSFFHEIRKDTPTALKHYNMTYSQLLETKVSNKHQIKILCGFINFKICQLSFRTGAPLDAIAQFDRHIKQFKEYTEPPELEFQHRQWLSHQFQFFGDLFNDAISAGLTALQTKHPGFYYLQAAQYTIQRRQLSDLFKDTVRNLVAEGKQVIQLPVTKYFGQFPWDLEHYNSAMTNGNLDADDCIFTIQHQELDIDYSRIIIPLLNKAVGQFKQYKPTRMKRYLMLEMGNEYYLAGDYEKAFSIAMCVLGEYRRERWWSLLTAVLDLCLKCAYLVGNVQDYIAICCELIGVNMLKHVDDKADLQNNLFGILQGKVPATREGDESTQQLWSKKLAAGQDYVIEMTKLSSFLSCSSSFTANTFQVDETIRFKIQLVSTAALPVTVDKVVVCFDNKKYDSLAVREEKIELQANSPVNLSFEMEPISNDAACMLKISSIKLHILGENSIVLQFGDVFPVAKCKIVPRVARATTSLALKSPVLVGEFQQLTVNLSNKEDCRISNVVFGVQVKSTTYAAEICKPNDNNFDTKLDFRLDCLDPQQSSDTSFIIRCSSEAKFDLSYVLSYSITLNSKTYMCESRNDMVLSSVAPFHSSISLMSSRCDPMETLLTCDRCLILNELTATHDSCIEIKDIKYDINPEFIFDETPNGDTFLLTKDNVVTDCIAIQPKSPSKNTNIGSVSVTWRRSESTQTYTTTNWSLPTVSVNSLPVYLTNVVPSYGTLFDPISIRLCVVNISNYVQEIDIVAEPGDLFMFAGHKHLRCKILPNDKEHLQYQLVPLKSGLLSMPQPVIKLLRHPDVETAVLTNKLTKSIYVKPKVFIT